MIMIHSCAMRFCKVCTKSQTRALPDRTQIESGPASQPSDSRHLDPICMSNLNFLNGSCVWVSHNASQKNSPKTTG